MNGEPAVRVLTMVPVYHLPKELEGPFESGRVRRGPERRVFDRQKITAEYAAFIAAAFHESFNRQWSRQWGSGW